MTRDDDRREYRIALLLLAAGAVLLLLGYGRTWVTASTAQEGLPRIVVALSGSDLEPLGGALPLVALAGVAGLVATRGTWRRVIGALLVLAGAVGGGLAVRAGLTLGDPSGEGATVDRIVGEKVGVVVTGVPTTTTSWWVVAALGGLLVAVGGVLALLHGARWPTLGRRYERGEQDGGAAPAPEGRPESAWDLLDRGVDPTVVPSDGTAGEHVRPDRPDRADDGDPMLGNGPGS